MFFRFIFFLTSLFFCVDICAKEIFSNSIFADDIKTLQVLQNGDSLTYPLIRQGTEDRVVVSFDQMSHNPHFYSYRVVHCESDWTVSSQLSEFDYIEGIQNNRIEDSYLSLNTLFEYTHYYFELPNDDCRLLLSGNYAVEIVDSENLDSVVAIACFSVTEDVVGIDPTIKFNTEYGVQNKYQQLDFSIDCGGLIVSSPVDELKLDIRQNGRKDNKVGGLAPLYTEGNKFHYKNDKRLIFEAGSEFYQIDFSHIRTFNGLIDRLYFDNSYYHVDVTPGEVNTKLRTNFDSDGKFAIHAQDVWSEREVDYSIVHFYFDKKDMWIDGNLYVSGYFNDNNLNHLNKMKYNQEEQRYELTTILKNGGYGFQYLFLPAGQKKAMTNRTMGDFWQTENEYSIYVYYHPYGAKYDRLVGVKTIKSR